MALARHIHGSCSNLRLAGLMTIGMPGAWRCWGAVAVECCRRAAGRLWRPASRLWALRCWRKLCTCLQSGLLGWGQHAAVCTPLACSPHPFPSTADYSSRPENFQCLSDCRKAVCEALGLAEAEVELRWGGSWLGARPCLFARLLGCWGWRRRRGGWAVFGGCCFCSQYATGLVPCITASPPLPIHRLYPQHGHERRL